MPWQERSTSALRSELVSLMAAEGANVSELCRRFGVSRKTAYKWRALSEAGEGLSDRSRRPKASPRRTPEAAEDAVAALRESHPTWGGRKIRAALQAQGVPAVPSASAVAEILRRKGLLDGPRAGERRDWERFERSRPNELWQMDFKGHFALGVGSRCHPFTLLDDHSRYLLGVRTLHGRPYHPQTQGKLERLHRTLLADAVAGRSFPGPEACQGALDAWREVYNRKRPHEALGMAVPASRYVASRLRLPDEVPEPPVDPADLVRRVQRDGRVSLRGREFRLGDGLAGQPVALRPLPEEGTYEVRFCGRLLAHLDLRDEEPGVTYVPVRV